MGKVNRKSAFWLKFTVFILLLAAFSEGVSEYIAKSDAYTEAAILVAEGRTVVIDAGHGGEDCGAIGVNGAYEKDLNFTVATMLGRMLSERGYAVVYTRTEDRLLYTEAENVKGIRKISDLKNRCKIGAEYPNATFISIHMNTYGSSKYSGLQVYYGLNDEGSYALATAIQSSVRTGLQPDNKRSVKRGEGMYLMENLDNTAVLIECGFISNPEECEKLCEKEYQKQLCFQILCGIIESDKSDLTH